MSVIDKAVSTEDLCAEDVPPALSVLRLDAILNTLVENKVEALKQENGKSSSQHSSPKSLLQKFKCHLSPKTILIIEDERKKEPKRKDKKGHKLISESKQFKRQVLRQETSSPDSHGDGHQYRSASCVEANCPTQVCYCNHGAAAMQVNDDYISIKMDGFGDIETDAIIAQEELKRARRKRRRRRKRRLKKRLALNPHLVDTLAHDSEFKSLNDDELPPRAKWTIVATACLLMFMCLLLVGITLRMAPIIDEIGLENTRETAELSEEKHAIRFEEMELLASTSHYHSRLLRKAIEIQKRTDKFNRKEEALKLNPIWNPILKNSKHEHTQTGQVSSR